MRIFFVCQRVPFPPDRGDKIATFNELRHLSAAHEVHVFCLADGMQDLDNVGDLRNYVASVTTIPVIGVASTLRAVRALLFGGSLSVAAFNEAELHAAIMQRFLELRPDLIIVFSSNVAQYAEPFPDVARIMQFHDLDSQKWGQYAQRSRIPLKCIYEIEQGRLLAYERSIARRFSYALVCTAVEKRDFELLIPGVPVGVVGNGVDLDYFRPAGSSKRPASIIFTGVMDYFPNVDAVLWFCDEILPVVQKQVPEANLTICGSRPATAVRRLSKRRGVTVTGRIPDIRPYVDQAEVFVAPLRMGRGIQNKLLEALAMGLPSVASTAAWSGTLVPKGKGVLVTDNPREFAEDVVHLLRDSDYRSAMARRARVAAETNCRWEEQMSHLDQVIEAVTVMWRSSASSPVERT